MNANAKKDGKRGTGTGNSRLAIRFLVLWTAAVVASATAFTVHLVLANRTLELGYDVGDARREQRLLVERKRTLELEKAMLSSPGRIDAIGRSGLELELTDEKRWVRIERPWPARIAKRKLKKVAK